jgi:hypothetical protein
VTSPALPYAVIAAVLLVGLAQRLYALARDPADPLRRAVCVVLAGLLLATVAQLFTRMIDAATGVVHLGWALADAGAMVSACAGRIFLLHVEHAVADIGNRARRRYAGLAVALGAAALLFVAFPPRPGQEAPVYDLVYIGYVGGVLVSALRLSIRYARRTDRPFLRVGLRVVTAGAAVGLAFVTLMGVELVTGVTEESAPAVSELGTGLELVTEALLLAGVTITVWGPALVESGHRLADQRAYRQLRPLWRALHDADPGFALLPPDRFADRWWPRDVGLLLYRQVIEIRDGQVALRPYVDPAATARAAELAGAAGLADAELRAVVAAAAIASGIAAKADGRPARASAAVDPALDPAAGPTAGDGDAGLAVEITWLRAVARSYTRSPIVRAVRRPGAGVAAM